MDALLQQHLQALVTLLALVNPLMCGALFARIDDRQDRKVQLADATKAAAAVLVILLLAALFGVRVLHLFDHRLRQHAGESQAGALGHAMHLRRRQCSRLLSRRRVVRPAPLRGQGAVATATAGVLWPGDACATADDDVPATRWRWPVATLRHVAQLLALSEQAVTVYSELLRLVKARRAAGKDTDLNVVDMQANVDSALGSVEAARQSYGDARRSLEALLGRYPAAEIEAAMNYTPDPPPIASGIPAALLQRRPDVIATERLVLAAFRKTEAAKLALLPDFSIALTGGRLADPLLTLLRLNPWLATAAIGAAIPVYEGGALEAQVRIATAQQAQAVARYGSVVLTAFREVETALATERV
jgi:hypothetical protein